MLGFLGGFGRQDVVSEDLARLSESVAPLCLKFQVVVRAMVRHEVL